MASNAEIFFEHDRWGKNLSWSLVFHVGIALAIIGYAKFVPTNSGTGWGAGGGGDAIGATLVSTVPLPATRAEKEQVLANESKGVTESLPKPEEKVEPEAIDIPDKDIKVKKSKPEPSATKR